jgi:tRNA(Ile)-lysidine synthase
VGAEPRKDAEGLAVDGSVRREVRVGGLLAGVPMLVAMLSGGRDSVCLLDVAVALLGPERVRALHVNYGLREEAEADERHCRSLCESLGVELSLVRAGRSPDAGEGNLQAWARELRYEAAESLAARLDRERGEGQAEGAAPGGATAVATGHTASDQVETILYRLAASPGRRALLGMAASEGRLVRPLLGVTRERTAAYCEARGLPWREDASNEDERFARARVRARLVPALREVHPAAEANVLRTARLLAEEAEALEEFVERELQAGAGAETGPSVSLDRLGELPAALARLVVIRLAERAVGGYVPQAGERVGELLALGARGGRAELHLGGLACAVLSDGELSVRRLAPQETSMRSPRTPPRRD